MTSLTWIKRVTGIGLCLMTPDAQRNRLNSVVDNGEINGPALARLIDECKVAATLFLEKNEGIISDEQRGKIKDVLNETDGKSIVANIAGDEDITWLLELRDKVLESGLSIEDLKKL